MVAMGRPDDAQYAQMRRQRGRIQALGGKAWKPKPCLEILPVFRIRDLPVDPERILSGSNGDLYWLDYVGSVQLRLPLDGELLENICEKTVEVKVCPDEVKVRCTADGCDVRSLDRLSGKLRRLIRPSGCQFWIERNVGDIFGVRRILVLELAKQEAGRVWPADQIFQESIFDRKSFGWTCNQVATQEAEDSKWVSLQPGRRPDVQDPFVVSRSWLCTELEQGQTDELAHFRIVLDQKKLDEALGKVSYNHLFAADCSRGFFKLFIRGDESSPFIMGRLGGHVLPDLTVLDLTTLRREVYGHRIAGTMETVPCLNVTLVKAPDAVGEWEEIVFCDDNALNQPQGTLEELEEQLLRKEREPSPEREDWTPDDWADEQKVKADAALKEGCYRDAIVYYTRALQHTPKNEKLLSNRCAGYLKTCQYQLALDDAEKAASIQPTWAKVYFRKGQALRGLKRFEDAISAFKQGLGLDPGNDEWEKEVLKTKQLSAAVAERRRLAKASKS